MNTISLLISPFPQLLKKVSSETQTTHLNDSLANKTFSSSLIKNFKSRDESFRIKITEIATVTLQILSSTILYWINPSLFAMGFIAGIIFDESISLAVEKIKCVWKNQPFLGSIIGIIACGLSLPVTLASASLICSGNLGAYMSKETKINDIL